MKQVWQTNDGGIFNTEQEARDWEYYQAVIDDLASTIYSNVGCVQYQAEAVEIATWFVNNYTFAPN